MIKPNVPCKVFQRAGFDRHGAAKYSSVAKNEKCLVVSFINKTDRSIVRVDAGASRGSGKEDKIKATLLFAKTTIITQGDKVEMLGEFLHVDNVHPRFSVRGVHDHNQVDLSIWQSE